MWQKVGNEVDKNRDKTETYCIVLCSILIFEAFKCVTYPKHSRLKYEEFKISVKYSRCFPEMQASFCSLQMDVRHKWEEGRAWPHKVPGLHHSGSQKKEKHFLTQHFQIKISRKDPAWFCLSHMLIPVARSRNCSLMPHQYHKEWKYSENVISSK